jgi:hypothetical protein
MCYPGSRILFGNSIDILKIRPNKKVVTLSNIVFLYDS